VSSGPQKRLVGADLRLQQAASRRKAILARRLIEVGAVLFGELGLVGGEVGFGKDRVLSADAGAVPAVDALVGIDEDLRDSAGGRVGFLRRDGGGGALGDTNEVFGACVGYDVSHE